MKELNAFCCDLVNSASVMGRYDCHNELPWKYRKLMVIIIGARKGKQKKGGHNQKQNTNA